MTIKRGRDVRKMDKPYTCREVVHTCSNGWTIECVTAEDARMEGFFMGHCLTEYAVGGAYPEVHSLREPDGTPHATITLFANGTRQMVGRCNMPPKAKYAKLVHEWCTEAVGLSPEAAAAMSWRHVDWEDKAVEDVRGGLQKAR